MNKLRAILALFVGLLGVSTGASAMLQLSLVPRESFVSAASTVHVDVLLSGLRSGTEPVSLGAFDFTLTYRADLMNWMPLGSRFGTGLGNPLDSSQTLKGIDDSVAGALSLYEVSLLEESAADCFICSGPYLDELQSRDSLVLAELLFLVPRGFDFAATAEFDFLGDASSVILGDASGVRLSDVSLRGGSVEIPEPSGALLAAMALLALAAVRLWVRRRGVATSAMAMGLVAASGLAQATPAAGPMPDGSTGAGPMTLTIRATAPVETLYRITEGNTGGCFGSLKPLLVQESKPRACADFRVASTQTVTLQLLSDPAQGASYTQSFTFTPGLYHIQGQFNSRTFFDDATFWIQKYNESIRLFEDVFEHTIEVDTQGKLFISSGGGDGILQSAVYDVTKITTKSLTIPGGAATLAKSELFPDTVYCTPETRPPFLRCPPISFVITAGDYGDVSLAFSPLVSPPVSRTVSTPYDSLVFTAPADSSLTVAHTRLAYVPPGPPTIDRILNPAPIAVGDGMRTLVLKGISDGGDGSQRLSLSAKSSSPSLIPDPSISYRDGERNGVLSYAVGPGATGLGSDALITVTLKDDGGTPLYAPDDSATTRSFSLRTLVGRPCEGLRCLIYASERDNGQVDVIDMASNTLAGTLVGAAPVTLMDSAELAVSADGRRIYVPARIGGTPALAVFDSSTRRQIAMVPVPAPVTALAVSVDGRELYALTEDLLVFIDIATHGVTHTLSLGSGLYADGLAFAADGGRAFVTTQTGRLFAIDTSTRQVAATATIPNGRHGIAVAIDGAMLYVSNTDADSVWVIDSTSLRTQATFPVGFRPRVPAVTPDGKSLIVPVFDRAFNGRLELFNTATYQPTGRIELGGRNGPWRVVVTPDGTRAYVVFDADRVVLGVALATGKILGSVTIGTPTIGLSMGPLPLFQRVLGDVNRDGEVDQRDLTTLLTERNKAAVGSSCGLACDLDGDGTITVLDARILSSRCTRAGCAAR